MVRIWLTEDCNALCRFCMNSKSRGKSQMSLARFELLCSYFRDNNFDIISIMGGEPTIHPHFAEMLSIAQKSFRQVYLYTNALQVEPLLRFYPREQDLIVYNSNFARQLNIEKLLLDRDGERLLEVIADNDTDTDTLLKNVLYATGLSKNKLKVQLVLNNSTNIFRHKKRIVSIVNYLYSSLQNNNVPVSFECAAPLCFTYNSGLPEHKNNTICPQEAILIDGDYNARFCNIYPQKLVNLFVSQDSVEMIPFPVLRNYITMESLRIKEKCLSKICKDCMYYSIICNGKCHIGQNIITREDIKENTSIPWLRNNE